MLKDEAALIKQKYYGHKIIYARFSYDEFLFRTLTREEYRYVKGQAVDDYDLHDLICTLACVYPEGYDFAFAHLAGLPDVIGREIERLSGFTDVHEILDSYYEIKKLNSLEEQCMNIIKAFIPEYTYEQMQQWTWHHLMEITARAEKVAKLRGFDWELNDKTDEMEKEYDKMNSDNEQFIMDLYEHGVDPMIHFRDELDLKKDIIEIPLIVGSGFNNEEVLNATREQIKKKKPVPAGRYL